MLCVRLRRAHRLAGRVPEPPLNTAWLAALEALETHPCRRHAGAPRVFRGARSVPAVAEAAELADSARVHVAVPREQQ